MLIVLALHGNCLNHKCVLMSFRSLW